MRSLAPTALARLLLLALAGPLATPTPRAQDVILDWNAVMMSAVRIDNSGPTLSSRNLAILHLAMFDAANSITRTHQEYLPWLEPDHPASPEAAAAAAGYEVLKALYPGIRPRADETFATWRATAPHDTALTNGIALGIRAAARLLDARSSDGSATDVPYIPSDAPGQWRRTPPFFRPPLTPGWRYVTPFALPAVDPFMPPPPPPLNSTAYARDLEEVRQLGSKSSTVRTEEESLIARFWSDFSYTAMPPGHWHEIATGILRSHPLDLVDEARLMALLGIAQADGAIVCWEAKFQFNLWRPVTAIQRANEDGNPATEPDPTWDHFLASPPFPAYPSGHSTFSQASASVLRHFFDTDHVEFTAVSDSVPGVVRYYSSFDACSAEIGRSRIYGGIHYEFDNQGGKDIGRRVARQVVENWLLPLDQLPLLRFENLKGRPPCLRLHGRTGTRILLESSFNLQDWTPVSEHDAVPGGRVVPCDPTAATSGFFRVRSLEPE